MSEHPADEAAPLRTSFVADAARRALLDKVLPIEGWLEPDEAWALHSAALSVAADRQDPVVVEIGSWKGRSTIAMALALKAKSNGILFAIDPHTGSKEHQELFGVVDTHADFERNINAAGVGTIVRPLRMTSHDARQRFANRSVDLLFVDGSHEYEDVLQDIDDWTPTLKEAAIVAFNDVWWPGVCRALLERVLNRRSPFRNPRMAANTLIFDIRWHRPWTAADAVSNVKARMPFIVRHRLRRIRRFVPEPLVRLWMSAARRWVGA